MESLLTRGRSQQLDDALSTGRPAPPAVSRELALATALREVGAVTAPTPSDEFRTALRTRLMAVAAVQGVGAAATGPTPARGRSWRERATVVGAGTLATVVAASGVAVAGSRSLPGEPFYGVKRTAEAVQLRVADGDHEEGTRHLQFATTRMQEVRDLLLGRDAPRGAAPRAGLGDGDLEDARSAMADMDDDTREGLRLLTGAFRETRASTPLEELRRFAARQRAGLSELMPALGGTALAQAQGSLALIDGVQAQADELLLLVDCTAACDPARAAPGASGGGQDDCDCGSPAPGPSQAAVPQPGSGSGAQPPAQQGDPAPASQAPSDAQPQPPAPAPAEPPPPSPGPALPLPNVPLPGATPGAPLPTLDAPDLDGDGVLPDLPLG